MLASHSRVMSFPETHYFGSIAPKPWYRPGPFVRNRSLAATRFERVAELLGNPALAQEMPRRSHLKRDWINAMVRVLDQLTIEAGKDVWIEKTPEHLSLAPMIQRYIHGACFIHIIRDGRSVVGSLVDVTRRHPDRWGGVWTAEKCAAVWNRAIKHHRRLVGRSGHIAVHYEALASEPERMLRGLCKVIGLQFEPEMLNAGAATRVIAPEEQWKSAVDGGSRGVASSKFETALSESEQQRIERVLSDSSGIRGIGDE